MGYVHVSAPRLVLVLVAAAIAGGCASTGARPRPFPVPSGGVAPPVVAPPVAAVPEPEAAAPASAPGQDVIHTALAFVGTPYRNGGGDPAGFDCSGFVQYVFARHGVALPRSVSTQFLSGLDVGGDGVRAGDLVFFSTTGPGATHVGIAIGDGRFVHAPSSRGTVRVESLSSTYWEPRLIGARRVIQP